MRNSTSKIQWLFLLMITLLLSSCETLCGAFDRDSELMTIVLFPDNIEHYDFAKVDDPNANILRLSKQRFEFSEAYTETCGNDCDCVTTHSTKYKFQSLPMALGNEVTYEFLVSDPLYTMMSYIAFNEIDQTLDDTEYRFPTTNSEILRDINNLLNSELTVNGETFNDVLTINLSRIDLMLYVERNKGLQGILYEGELYRRIN